MILFLDTSALVKLYANEAGSELVRSAVASASIVACHLLAYVEARAAFARKSREPGLEARLPQWRRGLEQDWEHFNVVEVSEGLVRRAGDLAEQYRLRGYDAVHLAAAESVMQLIGPAVAFRFAAFDGALVDAARAHGLPVL